MVTSTTTRSRAARRENINGRVFNAPGPALATDLPLVTVGVRFHDYSKLFLLNRCVQSIGAQVDVRVHLHLMLQDFSREEATHVLAEMAVQLDGSGFSYEVDNIPNPRKVDLRARLLNIIVERHYERRQSEYICFIDFDDVWYQKALATLVEPLKMAEFALSYADIHCADVYYDSQQIYVRNIKDVYQISQKTKRDLLRGNFLPLHSYMFHTGRIEQNVLKYDENLARLEDFDVLLSVARNYAFSGLYRNRCIGLYNFFETATGGMNTTHSVFSTDNSTKDSTPWETAKRAIIARHAGKPWHEFWGEEWIL